VTVLAAHQPNFFPWLGYFAKLSACDVFVLLDRVDWPKSSYVNRVKLRVGESAAWVTCPAARVPLGTPLGRVRIAQNPAGWRKKLIGTLRASYGRATHAPAQLERVVELIEYQNELVAGYNEHTIRTIAGWLGIRTRIARESELLDHDSTRAGSERLAALCDVVDASVYLAGDGASGYEDESAYDSAKVRLTTLGFEHPTYDQGGMPFLKGLSVLDAIMHIGPEETGAMLARTTAGRTP